MMRNDLLVTAVATIETASPDANRRRQRASQAPHRRLFSAGISAAVLAVALATPHPVRAAEECGPAEEGIVRCPAADDQYPDGIQYTRPFDSPRGELIVIVEPGTEIVTGSRGIDVVNFAGTAIIGADGVNISTSGDFADGVWALSFGESAFVEVGDVHTTGYGSGGINAVATRNAQVRARSVLTEGDEATGISVISQDMAARVEVGTVETRGANASAIVAISEQIDPELPFASGLIEISAGSLATSGDGSYGVAFLTGDPLGRATIVVDEVTTRGNDALGIYGTGAGTSSIAVGKVTTFGDFSTGIVSDKEFGNEMIEAGTIETWGREAYGVIAFNSFGRIETRANNVTTYGDDSHGIFQENFNGSVALDAGRIVTHGANSNGVTSASLFDRTRVSVGNVETNGSASLGVFAAGGRQLDALVGNVITRGDSSAGVRLISGSAGRNVPLIRGAIVAEIGSVETSGANSVGVSATALGTIDLKVGRVHTIGTGSIGVNSLMQDFGTHDVTVGEVFTEGDQAEGLLIGHNSLVPDSTMSIDVGNVRTLGNLSSAVRIEEELSETTLAIRGDLVTAGDFSHGVWLSHARGGSLAVASPGKISTTGFGANGINLDTVGASASIDVRNIVTAGDAASAIRITALDEHIIDEQASRFLISAGTLTTAGADAHGIDILLEAPGGGGIGGGVGAGMSQAAPGASAVGRTDIDIRADSILVAGERAAGIRIDTIGAVRIASKDIESRQAEAIAVTAREAVDLSLAGRTVSGGAEAVRVEAANIAVALTAAGSITSKGDALVLAANGTFIPDEEEGGGGIGPFAFAGDGAVTLDNGGAIRSEQGYAVRVTSGRAAISNRGLMSGGIALFDGDDLFANAGVFEMAAANDFGDGADSFVNTGTVRLRAGAATLAGLESFDNRGLIDLGNGSAGDVLTLTGAYTGGANATLVLDVSATASDRLVIGGAATGSTQIQIRQAGGRDATLFAGRVDLVTAGAGTSADAFTLSNPASGFVAYTLAYDPTARTFGVSSRAGASIHRLAKVQDALQALSLKPVEAWGAHAANLRADVGEQRLWGQLFGGRETRKGSAGTGAPGPVDVRARQDFFGGQIGYDIVQAASGEGAHLGVTANYTGSKLRFRGGDERGSFDYASLGVYGGVRAGSFFANGLVQYDRYWLDLTDAVLGWEGSVKGKGYRASGELGFRLATDRFFAEPTAMLSWGHSSLGTLQALGQTIDFDNADGLRGRVGLRIGATVAAGKTEIDLYGGGNYAKEFAGSNSVAFLSNGISEEVAGRRLESYGEGYAGLRVRASDRVSGFVEGKLSFGGSVEGAGGRAGLRIAL